MLGVPGPRPPDPLGGWAPPPPRSHRRTVPPLQSLPRRPRSRRRTAKGADRGRGIGHGSSRVQSSGAVV